MDTNPANPSVQAMHRRLPKVLGVGETGKRTLNPNSREKNTMVDEAICHLPSSSLVLPLERRPLYMGHSWEG